MTRREICRKASREYVKQLKRTFEERFWNRVQRRCFTDCWNWIGSTKPNGYGEVKRIGRAFLSHRLAFEMCNGPIPKGMNVCHKCDNKSCVNPDHLFLGTQDDNVQDCIKKGRRRYRTGPRLDIQGEKHPNAKLTDRIVRMIRSSDLTRLGAKVALSRKLGVTGPLISAVLSRRIWKHVQ